MSIQNTSITLPPLNQNKIYMLKTLVQFYHESPKNFFRELFAAVSVFLFVAFLLWLSISVTSCQNSHLFNAEGRAVMITNDTTIITHSNIIQFPKK